MLEPLDAEAVRAIAARRAACPPTWLLDAAAMASRAGCTRPPADGRGARRRAASTTAAGRTAAGRAELRSVEAELTGGVIELQAAREDAEWAGQDDAPVRCPFKGLASFDVADAPYFFGRERLVAELVARLVGASLLGVVGPSGSGKSSVVRAGLLPALAGGVLPGSADWERVVMRPGEHPLRELANATARIDRDASRAARGRPVRGDLHRVPRRGASAARSSPSWWPRRGVVGSWCSRSAPTTTGAAAPTRSSSRLLAAHHVLVSAMRRDELRRAVERPAQRAGLRVEPELTDALVGDVEHEPGALPMLSTALLELWQRRDGRRLRLATYEATGGVRGAVARHAEDAFARLDRGQQALARRVLLAARRRGRRRHDRAPADRAGRARRRRVAEVVAVLTDQRLLTVSAGAVELAHEALLREWPRLRGWLEEDAEGRRLHRRLADAAREWDDAGRDAGDLYRGARLAGALEWRARHEPDLNRTERDFLDAGRDAEQREHHAAQSAAGAPIALGVAVLAVITGISTILAVRGIQRARYEQRAARLTRARHARARTPARQRRPGRAARDSRPTAASRPSRPAAPSCPYSPRSASYRRIGKPARARRPRWGAWRSAPTDGRSPAPPTTGRSRSGTWPRGDDSAARSAATTEPSTPWRSAPTERGWRAAATTGRSGCGTSRRVDRSAIRSASTTQARSMASRSAPTARPSPAAPAEAQTRRATGQRDAAVLGRRHRARARRGVEDRRRQNVDALGVSPDGKLLATPAAITPCSYGTRRPVASSARRSPATPIR